MEWPTNLFPQDFKGNIFIKQDSSLKNIQAETICGIILTIIAQSNDWQKKITFKEILVKLVDDKFKLCFFLERGKNVAGICQEVEEALGKLSGYINTEQGKGEKCFRQTENGSEMIKPYFNITVIPNMVEFFKQFGEIDNNIK